MRAAFGAALVCLAGTAAIAASDPDARRQAYERAYGQALRCVSANAAIRDDTGGRLAFDAALKLGHLLGYDNRRLNADLGGGSELVEMARSDRYLQQTLDGCARVGLTSINPRVPAPAR